MRTSLSVVILFSFSFVFSQVKVKSNDNVETVARKITQGAATDSLKIEAIYTWITHNIAYDYASYLSGEPYPFQSPEKVLSRRKTTCTGYVNLMHAMLQTVGVASFQIEGITRDFNLGRLDEFYYSTHAWLAFRCNGTWYACDPTWDAGYVGMMEKTKKRTFRVRIAGFWTRVANVFRRKARKQPTSAEVNTVRTYFKVGFIQQPTRTYFFAPIDQFQQTHLSSVAHMQMRSDPLSVREFLYLDSLPVKVDSMGTFPFQTLNNQFSSLDLEQRSLWMADSVLQFSRVNETDRTIHLYEQFRFQYAVKNPSLPHVEQMLQQADSILAACDRSLAILKQLERKKRTELVHHFQLERAMQRGQDAKMRYMNTLKSNARAVYERGKTNYETRELPFLEGALARLDYSKARRDPAFGVADQPAPVRAFLQQFDSLTKLVTSLQTHALVAGETGIAHVEKRTDSLESLFYHKLNLLLDRGFGNELAILRNDSIVDGALQQLAFSLRDSLIGLTGSRQSMRELMLLDKWIRSAETKIPDWKRDFPSWDEKAFRGYVYLAVDSLFRAEMEVIQRRLQRAAAAQHYLAKRGGRKLLILNKYFQAQTQVRAKRQNHIHKELYAFVNRPKKVVTMIRKQVKNQRIHLSQLARELRKTTS